MRSPVVVPCLIPSLSRRACGLLVTALLLAGCGGTEPTAPGGGTPGGGTPGGGTPTVSNVVVAPTALTLVPGQTAALSATATSSAGATVTATVTWSSGNSAVASVSAAGLVTAVASGSTVIEARVGTVVGRSTVVVADTLPVSLVITPADTLPLTVGQTQPLAATARSASGAVVGALVSWESETPSIASVSASGVVSAVARGATVIRARTGTLSASLPVVVAPPAPSAPTNLATVARRGEVELTWTDNSGGEAGFEIERLALPDSTFAPMGATTTGVPRFVDTLDLAADTLVYRVRAVVPGAASAFAVDTVVAPIPPLHVTAKDVAQLANTLLPSPSLPADGRDLGAELAAIVPRLLEHPDVITVLLQQEVASAQLVLRDGLSINLAHNKVPTAAELAEGAALRLAQASAPREPWAMSRQRGSVAAPAIPGSKDAGIISIGGGAEVLPEIRGILDAGGYSVRALDGSIEGMRGWRGLGALYFDTHGTAWREVRRVLVNSIGGATGVEYGDAKYALETTTKVTSADISLYRGELSRGELTINIVPVRLGLPDLGVDLPIFDAKFAITETFIAKHWSLDDAIVVLHSCFGGSGPFTSGTCSGACATAQASFYDPTVIRSAMLAAGATVVQSYDHYVWPTTSLPSMAYFLDRLAGANKRPPMAEPERRPFDLARVRAAMGEQGLLRHVRSARSAPNTTFATSKPDAEIIGVPSIREIDVIDDAASATGRVELLGTFGSERGSVRVGGTTAAVTSWTPTKITLNGPFTGPGATGQVVVESPGGLESNEVPLTEWRGGLTLTLEFDGGTAKAVGEVDVKFRADVHDRRLEVERDPATRTVSTYISPATFGRVVGSGVLSTSATGRTARLTGNEELEILNKATVDGGGSFGLGENSFGGLVTIDLAARTLELCFSLNGAVTVRAEGGGEPLEEYEVPALFVLPALVDFQRGMMQCLRLPLSASFGTPSGRRTAAQDGARATLEWTAFQASNPPERETKG